MKYGLFIIGLFICCHSGAQTRKEIKKYKEVLRHFNELLYTGSIAQSDFTENVHFEYVREKILVKVYINGKEYTFLFDTGAPDMLSE